MAPLAVDPNTLSGAGVTVATSGDGLASALAALTGSINANTGYDAAGVFFGRQYIAAAGELLKAITSGANACRNVGYGIQMSAVNYSRAEAASDISGRTQELTAPPCPAPLSAPGSPSSGGDSVPPPLLWSVVQQFVGSAWPDGNPAELRSAAAAWRAAAGPLNGVGADVSGARGLIAGQSIGEGPAIAAHIDGIATGVSSIAGSCEELAASVEQYAARVEKTQQAICDLCNRLGSIGGIVGTFFEFVRGHGLDEVHEIADEIKTVITHFGSETDATLQLLESAKQSVDSWVVNLEKSANKQFVEFFGEPVGTALSSQFNQAADTAEGVFRWGTGFVEGVAALDPTRFASDPEGARQTWEGLEQTGRLLTNPVQEVLSDPRGSLETVKGLVHAEDWSKDRPMLGATEVGLDVASAVFPFTKAGALGKAGGGARALEESGETNTSVHGVGPAGSGKSPLSGITKNTTGVAEQLDELAKQPISSTPPAGGRPVSLPEDTTHGTAPAAKTPGAEPKVEPTSSAAPTGASPSSEGPATGTSEPKTVPAHESASRPPVATGARQEPLQANGAGDHLGSGDHRTVAQEGASGGTNGRAPVTAEPHITRTNEPIGIRAHDDVADAQAGPSKGDRPEGSAPPRAGDEPELAPSSATPHDTPPLAAKTAPAEASPFAAAPPAHHTGDGSPPTDPPPQEPHQAGDDGGWQYDEFSYLNPDQHAMADEFLDQARRAEPRITEAMERIAENTPGSELTGLDHRLKTEESFKEKLSTAIQDFPDRSVAEHLASMKDSVRYTLQSTEGAYVQDVTKAIDSLLADGYEPINFKNTWGQPGYQGINSFWRDPVTGHIFEVQFHTPESFDAKMSTHPLYEEARLPSTSPERTAEASRMQEEIFSAVPRPKGSPGIRLPGNGGSK